ncbi:MAG TPA: glycosyltransferase family 4 protein [Gemmatimonadaceae bacterium]|nr:glycosyltransferase family 4 protein [Gemmatimonadaceae bacterium]
MRILHFLPWHSPRTRGGTEVFLMQLAKLQQSRGDEVSIIAPNDTRVAGHEQLDGLGVSFFPNPYGLTDTDRAAGPNKKEIQRLFVEMVDTISPDVMHLHGIDYFLQSFFEPLAGRNDLRMVLTIHLVNVVCPNQTLRNETGQFCTRRVDFATCSTCIGLQRHRKQFTSLVDAITIPLNDFLVNRWGSRHIADRIPYQKGVLQQTMLLDFLRNSVSVDVLSPWFYDVLMRNGFAPDRIGLRPNHFLRPDSFAAGPLRRLGAQRMKFLFVGRLSTDKGVGVVIEALKGVADLNGELEVTFLGKHLEPELVEALHALRASGFKLAFPGEASPDDVERSLRDAHYLIFPSLSEEMAPLVIQEALQNGVPVISSDTSSAAAFITDSVNGILFRRGEASDLTRAIRRVVERKSLMSFVVQSGPDIDSVLYSYYQRLYTE